ncbi:M15 family metallopeptidase [Brevibacillus sp. M2.1A]|uniref:M15 family metallopeptidase n=1 Tax=Brevibacillus TaxID=55080 RepID=UPI00156B25CF|nr:MULTISPECIES: M15 family metallopeptidase [Brevibacillus]MBY0084094.1 M15 family metallopeptidase [Brevibacillus brevis]MCC8436362.1 M15 family metallopeptidase [Brevibacillus sp. M2.1A]UKK98566.1 M15 family metallopeptidase [Brevibacillus brevis]
MKKRFLLLGILLLLLGYPFLRTFIDALWEQKEPYTAAFPKYKAIRVEQDQIYQGDLLLVNKNHPIHSEAVPSDVILLSSHKYLVEGYRLQDNSIELSENAAEAFNEMAGAASSDNVNDFMIKSGYRSLEKTGKPAEEKGHDEGALPDCFNEHHLGTALDVASTQMKIDQSPEGKWLQENAWKYGFILRYPKEKVTITGIPYNPMHYRFIGLPHSAIMQERQFSLEEYVNYLREAKEVSGSINGGDYKIYYYPVNTSIMIQVPTNGKYVLSGDNQEGVIVTEFL